nr:dihydroxyacetone kinase subunit DhaK [Oscillibacter sp.]
MCVRWSPARRSGTTPTARTTSGLAGAVALYHIAAAAAREGKTLEEVAEIAQHYADNMASITVKSTDATHPQNGMSFGDLGETDLMEIGAANTARAAASVPMMSSKDTVATVAEALCKALDLKPGDKTFVMINGCGATTMMEMLVLFKDTVEFLKAKGIEVVASMVGEILTVQEAAGFQMNIAKWDEEMLRLWNTPCRTPAFSKE